MPTENERRVEDFANGSKALLDEWTARMGGIAQKLDTDALTVDDVVKTWAASTRLAMKGWQLAYSVLGDPRTGPDPAHDYVVSEKIAVPQNAKANVPVLLSFSGPLVAVVGEHQIPVGDIEVMPRVLQPTETEFRFQFRKGTHPTVVYRGTVEFRTGPDTAPVATLGVTIEVE